MAQKSVSKRTIVDALKVAAISYFAHLRYSCHFEIGIQAWGRRRADMLAVNMKSEVVLAEIKSSVEDLTSDRKWRTYLDYADKMYFIFSQDTFDRLKARGLLNDIKDEGVGILVLCPNSGRLQSKSPALKYPMDANIKSNLITRLAWRGGQSKRTHRQRVRIYL
jgi:hypothetical protein